MSKQKPWNLEIFRGFDADFSENQLLVNTPIRDFIDNEDKYILLGAKGLGKTLFLRYKSFLYRQRYRDSVQFNASQTELVDPLNIHADTFSKEELLRFRDEGIWRLIWELALWTMMFRLLKIPVNPQLDKLIESSHQLSNILTHLLNQHKKLTQYRAFVSDFQEQKGKIQNSVVLFLDDVDQTLQALLKDPHQSDFYPERTQSPSVEVWVNAQMGLVGAIYNLSRQNAHIKIYATIRREAFEAYEGEMKINYRQHISKLEYTKFEIQQIFQKNIQLIDPSDLIFPEGETLISKYVGFNSMPHRFAMDPNGTLRTEEVFNFIHRHTFGRPREIVFMGHEINELVASLDYKTASFYERHEQLRTIVNRVSNELFRQYKEEVIPFWDDFRLQDFVSSIRSNVLTREDFRLLDINTLRLYFNLGLIGYVRPTNHEGLLRQVFNPPATYNYRNYLALPQTDFLVIHSTLDTLLLEQHTFGNFYNRYNIIGDGYDFYPRVDTAIRPVAYYTPKDISGNRLNAPSESGGHGFALNEIYVNFFNFDRAIGRYERFNLHWRMADQVLGLLARICYCHFLEKRFGSGFYAKREKENIAELDRFNYLRQYNAEIPDNCSEASFNRFLDKLIGRYIVLGCYLLLDLRVEWIHTLLTQGRMDFGQTKVNKGSAFSYLSRSFFIRELKSDEPRDPRNPENRFLKQRIFNNLSSFEQESLNTFIRNVTDEINYLGWLETPEHKAWLLDHVLKKIWRPE